MSHEPGTSLSRSTGAYSCARTVAGSAGAAAARTGPARAPTRTRIATSVAATAHRAPGARRLLVQSPVRPVSPGPDRSDDDPRHCTPGRLLRSSYRPDQIRGFPGPPSLHRAAERRHWACVYGTCDRTGASAPVRDAWLRRCRRLLGLASEPAGPVQEAED